MLNIARGTGSVLKVSIVSPCEKENDFKKKFGAIHFYLLFSWIMTLHYAKGSKSIFLIAIGGSERMEKESHGGVSRTGQLR